MYESDSFFTLSAGGQLGLAMLSVVLSLAVLWALWRGTRALPRAWRVALALVGFWFFVWLSPQVYYQYYRLIIDGLPAQWVVWPPRWPAEAAQLLIFQGPANLSAHGQGVLGWLMICVALVGNIPFRRNAAN